VPGTTMLSSCGSMSWLMSQIAPARSGAYMRDHIFTMFA
jgi:hypothetical protein